MYINCEGRPCKIQTIQKLLKYHKEYKRSIPYRYVGCVDLYTHRTKEQFFYSGMKIELLKVYWKEYVILDIKIEEGGTNEILTVEKGYRQNQKSKQKIFLMPTDRMDLCKQMWHTFKSGKRQEIRTICAMGEEQIDTV